jgi:hypothetical protein
MTQVPLNTFITELMCPWNEKWGYIYGASGQKCSLAFRQSCAAANPSQASNILSSAAARWDGRTVADCSGLARYLYQKFLPGEKRPWSGASTLWKLAISDQQEIDYKTWKGAPGWAVFRKDGTNSDGSANMGHTAILVETDDVIEMRGTSYGVCRGTVSSYGTTTHWTHAGRFTWVNYGGANVEQPEVVTPEPTAPATGTDYVVKTVTSGFISLWDSVSKKTALAPLPDTTHFSANGNIVVVPATGTMNTMLPAAVTVNNRLVIGYIDGQYLQKV